MRDSIPKNIDGYKDIDASDLALREITERERECIERYLKKLRAKPVVPIALALFVGTAMPVLLLLCVEEWTTEIIGFTVCFSALFYVAAIIGIRGRLKANAPVIGVQTGLVNGVWSQKKGKGNSRRYYMDVVFPAERKRMKKVFCTKKDYEDVSQGDAVIVFAFTKTRAYGCKVK